MIILDTNVLSELMRVEPDKGVVDWLDRQAVSSVLITAVTVAEILHGIERLPDGRSRHRFATIAATMFEEDFVGRILTFDAEAAVHYAEKLAASERRGRQVHMADAQIAAIAMAHGAVLATRNVRDFDPMGIDTINPWQPEPG